VPRSPSASTAPCYRIRLFGDEIEQIQHFDEAARIRDELKELRADLDAIRA